MCLLLFENDEYMTGKQEDSIVSMCVLCGGEICKSLSRGSQPKRTKKVPLVAFKVEDRELTQSRNNSLRESIK
jgi:hypothetical protein